MTKNFCAAFFVLCFLAAPARAEEPVPAAPPPATPEVQDMERRMQEMGEAYKDYKDTGNEASRLKAKQNADQLMVEMNIAMSAMPVMIKLCGITGGKADSIVSLNKRTSGDALLTLDAEKKKQLTEGLAAVEEKLTADWQSRSPEEREQACAAIRKQVGE